MKVTSRVYGAEDLQRRLNELPKAVSARLQRQALVNGARPILQRAIQLAPFDESADATHLKDEIGIGNATSKEKDDIDADVAIVIGPSRDAFYGSFQELGTAHHPAHPFMRPAFDGEHKNALRIAASMLWNGIKRAMGGGVSTTSGRV